jgi:hypothetical protein
LPPFTMIRFLRRCMAPSPRTLYQVMGFSRRPLDLLVNSGRPRPIAIPNDAFGTARFLQQQVPTHSLLIRSQEAARRLIVSAALGNYQILGRFLPLERVFPDSNSCGVRTAY